jgi:CheY-like chemotaxis protein
MAHHSILVVEDNPDSRELLSTALRGQGYDVIEAENGKYAVLEASLKHPDLIIMDLTMPEMDGVEAARRILQVPKLAETPILVVSAYATAEVRADAFAAGCKEVMEKPIDVDVLLEKVKSLVDDGALATKFRREVERVPVSLRMSWGVTPQCPRDGTITSLSVKGCLIQTELVDALTGKPIFLSFLSLDGNRMSLQGSVLYYLRRVGFGMEFTELTDQDKSKLRALVTHHSRGHSHRLY